MPTNTAAWLPAKAAPLEVKPAPYTPPQENEIVIKNGAVAINPVDWAIQAMGESLFPWLTYPLVLGFDVAGTVTEVGGSVTRFKPGDRVLGHALALSKAGAHEGAFQSYTVLKAHMASAIPASLAFEHAAVIPLGLSTAACGLFQKNYLALEYPAVPPRPTGETLLVWGGSTSVGCNAIQLAVAAGYEVFTTCSPRNWEYVKGLGASLALDYSSETVVEDLVQAFKGKTCAGALAIGNVLTAGNGAAAATACVEVVAKSEGKKFVAMAMRPPETLPEGIEAKFIFGSDLKDNEVSKVVYEEFLPKALEQGVYVAAPEPEVVGTGLECIQEAFERQKKGVSARKVVVSL